MALCSLKHEFILLIVVALALPKLVTAGDPDITSDFVLPPNVTSVDGNYFTYTAMRTVFGVPFPKNFTVKKASIIEFPALNGQGVSFTLLQFPPGALNPPHLNSRSSGLLFLISGYLQVGLVDTSNKLYSQKLQAGDLFLFPKGLVHHQYNPSPSKTAIALASFGNVNAGTVSVPGSVFTTGISDVILAKAFKTDICIIQKLKAGLAPKA